MVLRLHPARRSWDDVSEFVVHFTRDVEEEAAFNFVSILRDGCILARNKFGVGRGSAHCRSSVSLTEAPLHMLRRVADRRGGPYGIGFHKVFAVAAGGGPVFYAYQDLGDAVRELLVRAENEPDDPVWRIAPFVDQPLENYAFEWEREWRIPNDVVFRPAQVRFLTVPEEQHARIRDYLAAQEEHGFPRYRCPLIDLNWDLDRMRAAVGG